MEIPFYPNLSWLHYERLLRVKDADARLWYLKEVARETETYPPVFTLKSLIFAPFCNFCLYSVRNFVILWH